MPADTRRSAEHLERARLNKFHCDVTRSLRTGRRAGKAHNRLIDVPYSVQRRLQIKCRREISARRIVVADVECAERLRGRFDVIALRTEALVLRHADRA